MTKEEFECGKKGAPQRAFADPMYNLPCDFCVPPPRALTSMRAPAASNAPAVTAWGEGRGRGGALKRYGLWR